MIATIAGATAAAFTRWKAVGVLPALIHQVNNSMYQTVRDMRQSYSTRL